MVRPKLTKRIVVGLVPATSEFIHWCGQTKGFGVRVHPSGKKTFTLQIRINAKQCRFKLGQFGVFTVEQARHQAEEIKRSAAKKIDPREEAKAAQIAADKTTKDAISVAELCGRYLAAAEAGLVVNRVTRRPKRASTVAIDRGRIQRHIVPLIGNLSASAIERSDIQRMHDDIAAGKTSGTFKSGKMRGKARVRGGAGTAARVVELVGGVFSWANARGLRKGDNPARQIETIRGERDERSLNAEELAALGRALESVRERMPKAAAAVELIALTGMRREEACGLRWSEIDFVGRCLCLESTKSGRSIRPLGRAAAELLQRQIRLSDTFVFPGTKDGKSADLKRPIAHIFDVAGLKNARSKALRKTFTTVAAGLEYSDTTAGALVGHQARSVTSRHYIRRPHAALIAVADVVADRVAAMLAGSPGKEVVNLESHRAGIAA